MDTGADTAVDTGVDTGTDAAVASVVINEIDSNPTDFVELYNRGSTTVSIAGWTIRDNDTTNTPYAFAAGTTIAAGAYVTVTALGFGLGGGDSVTLRDNNAALVDTYAWTAHAAGADGSFARCPNGTGALVERPTGTQNAANNCP